MVDTAGFPIKKKQKKAKIPNAHQVLADPAQSLAPTSVPSTSASASSNALAGETSSGFPCPCGRFLKTQGGLKNHTRRCPAAAAPSAAGSELLADDQEGEGSTPPQDPNARSLKRSRSRSSSVKPKVKEQQAPEVPLPTNFPPFFTALERQFRCLNTVHSFCQVQRQVVCTLQGIRRSVQSLSGAKLTLADLGAMRAVAPSLITLYWTEQMDLREATVREMLDPVDMDNNAHVLVIEFRDARPVQVMGKQRSAGPEFDERTWQPPSLTESIGAAPKSNAIPAIVERRNRNFREFLLNYVAEAAVAQEDPVQKVREQALMAVPSQPGKLWAADGEGTGDQRLDPLPDRPADLVELVAKLRREVWYTDQMPDAAIRVAPARPPTRAPPSAVPLSEDLASAIRTACGIEGLYTHQTEAISALEQGHNVIVSTATSSGKSLIYQLPVLRALETDSQTRAMFIFPTKALAQDQKRALMAILACTDALRSVHVDTYDGDTALAGGDRAYIRENASVIFTNPDMVHLSILPGHKQWSHWLQHLRFVIVDELHYYCGAFASHCAMIMRRLRRICHLLGNDNVKFISCSATVASPRKKMSGFFGLPPETVRVVDVDGAPTGRKLHAIWNPAYKDPRRPSQGRGSPIEDAVRLIAFLMDHGVRVICFAKVRQMCEILTKELQFYLREKHPHLVPRATSYRGGYTREDRREIEGQMFRGELLCIIATNALELGVDIGSLDVVVHLGFPFNHASYRQQSGRAGRRERDSMSVLVCDGDNPLDQHYAVNPSELWDTPIEPTTVELENELILDAHLQCAAFEWPIDLSRDGAFLLPHDGDDKAAVDACGKFLRYDTNHRVYFAHPKWTSHPSHAIPIRSIDDDHYRVVDVTTRKTIEEIEAHRVPFTLYEGSIFLHQGSAYLVFEVSAEHKSAKVRPSLADYITRPRDYTDIDPIKTTATLHLTSALVTDVKEFLSLVPDHKEPVPLATDRKEPLSLATDSKDPLPLATDSKDPLPLVTDSKDPLPLATDSKGPLPQWARIGRTPAALCVHFGTLRLKTVVFGYFKINPRTKQRLAAVDGLENPPVIKHRTGIWTDVPERAVDCLRALSHDVASSVHAASHAVLSLLPANKSAVAADLRAECRHPAATRRRPARIIVYDAHSDNNSGKREESAGVLGKAFETFGDVVRRALERVEGCVCESGCPECVHRASCKEANEACSKAGAIVVLRAMCGGEGL
ncbi:hypothetical protein HDU89_003549 [Geranomyces variabilis]|nr:hypothetical protein HDU89_003549 [Geranomyces variabilis]